MIWGNRHAGQQLGDAAQRYAGEIRNQLQRALLELDRTPEGRAILATAQTRRFFIRPAMRITTSCAAISPISSAKSARWNGNDGGTMSGWLQRQLFGNLRRQIALGVALFQAVLTGGLLWKSRATKKQQWHASSASSPTIWCAIWPPPRQPGLSSRDGRTAGAGRCATRLPQLRYLDGASTAMVWYWRTRIGSVSASSCATCRSPGNAGAGRYRGSVRCDRAGAARHPAGRLGACRIDLQQAHAYRTAMRRKEHSLRRTGNRHRQPCWRG